MVSHWFEPRDITSFIWELCYRAEDLSPPAVLEAAASLSDLMDGAVKNTNLGQCSIRSLMLSGVKENISRQQRPR